MDKRVWSGLECGLFCGESRPLMALRPQKPRARRGVQQNRAVIKEFIEAEDIAAADGYKSAERSAVR